MHGTVPVVKVKPWHVSQGEYVEINESDFDASKHELFEPAADAPKKRGKKEPAADAAE